MRRLYDVAKVLRSKNAGPFSITLDVLFENKSDYEEVKRQGIISRERIAGIYKLAEEDITELVYFDQACGIKVTFNRSISSGTCGDRDVYGAQQHAPLMAIALEEEEV
ncbi:MAG: DUF4387 domain-containing protein [Acetatifactor sp.]|nr:DUF4387 domain-containing protein [Acetatifactor sp.]